MEAYLEMERSGKGAVLEARILKYLIDIYPRDVSRLEISQEMNLTINNVTSKVNALLKKKLINDDPKRPCRITGKTIHAVKAIMDDQQNLF